MRTIGLLLTGRERCGGVTSFVFCLLLLSIICACNPAPKYARPPAQSPTAYKESAAQLYKESQGWKMAQPGDDRLREDWWNFYNDPQLSSLEEQVQVSNQSIKEAEASFREARALVVSAHSALFPVLSTSPSYTNSRSSQTSRGVFISGGSTANGGASSSSSGSTAAGSGGSTTGTSNGVGGTSSSGTFNEYSLPFAVSYEVDFWHRIRNNIAANAYQAQASSADIATALLSTQAALAEDYFEIRALDTQRKILEDTVGSYRDTLHLTQVLFQTGIDSDEEVAQAQTQLDTAIAQLTDLGVARAQFEHAIATLIGKPPAAFSLAVAPFNPHPPPVPLSLPSEMLERRPDISAAERRVAAANAQIGVARAAYYPNVTLSASGGLQTSQFLQWFTWPSKFWSVGPQVSQTILDGGARRGATEQAEASYDATVAAYRQTVLTAFQAVEDNLSNLRILSAEVQQQHTAVHSASHSLDLALVRFKTGVDSYLNVITTQTIVLTNRETEVQLQLRQMTSSVGLVMALGGGWNAAQLPTEKDLLTRPPKWSPAGPLPTLPPNIGPPNPPPLPATLPTQSGINTGSPPAQLSNVDTGQTR
jgi:NodT family efflux transporter outer membrane factor (OMF) lipoprotein